MNYSESINILRERLRVSVPPRAVAALVLILLAGCAPRFTVFDPTESSYRIKPGSIAVIGGNNDQFDQDLAAALTGRLKSTSRLAVTDQERIRTQLKHYPADFVTVDREEDADIVASSPAWFRPEDAERIAALHKDLKTDYVMVVWGDYLTKITEVSNWIIVRHYFASNINMRLIEFPAKKIVAYTDYRQSVGPQEDETDKQMIDKLIGIASDSMVEKLIRMNKLQKESP